MKTAADKRPERAVTVTDGTVGLNINPRKAGARPGSTTSAWKWRTWSGPARGCASATPPSSLKRRARAPLPASPPTTPRANLFDLSQENMENRTSVYVEPPREQARAISHLALAPCTPTRSRSSTSTCSASSG